MPEFNHSHKIEKSEREREREGGEERENNRGKEKIKVSRKNLAFGAKNIIISFFKKSTKKFSGSTIFVKILAPLRVKTIFLRALKNYSKNARLLINTIHKKCFNGCKVPKKKRKKQRGLRVFK